MKLSELLSISDKKSIISIVGGGGKTSTLFTLAGELKEKRVLLTTTTKILKPEISEFYDIIIEDDSDRLLLKVKTGDLKNHIVCGVASKKYPEKIVAITPSFIEKVKEAFDVIIIESDGSAGRPIKAPSEHEPVISPETDLCIGLIGLDCLGNVGSDTYVHRPEYFSKIREKTQIERITVSDMIKLINSPEGLFKNAPQSCRKIVLINKGDLISSSLGVSLVDQIFEESNFPIEVILNSYKKKEPVLYYRI